MKPNIPDALETCLLGLLTQTSPIKEYDLMKQLVGQGFTQFTPSLDELTLFRSHFLLFHILYRLSDKWRDEQKGQLTMRSIEIVFEPFSPIKKIMPLTLVEKDTLRDYYLDYDTFLSTQKEDVLALINQFWNTFAAYSTSTLLPDALKEAMQTLNMPNDMALTRDKINHHYRQLSAIHHPDKGGEVANFQAISQAADQLRKHIKHMP